MQQPRRTFLLHTVGVASALAGGAAIAAQTPLAETEPQAVALGYKADATKVDKAKFPKYTPGQMCANCQLYGAKPTEPMGPCAIFPNKLVAAKGWCSAWVKKA